MGKCSFCKTKLEKGQDCPHCGKVFYYSLFCFKINEGNVNYKKYDVYYSDKYIISKKSEIVDLSLEFGLIGSLLQKLVKSQIYDFYDVSNIGNVTYPAYINEKIKSDCTIRFEDKNGSAFFTTFKTSSDASQAFELFRQKYLHMIPGAAYTDQGNFPGTSASETIK